ncbi:MAG: MraZ protein [Candidatus Paceibacteria bacterium]|jgi:MraZ protein
MFNESSEHPLDKKFRVFVPKRLQKHLPEDKDGNRSVVLTKGEDGCLFLFGEDGFQESLGTLDTRAYTSRDQRFRQRRLTKDASQSLLDSSGRLLIGPKQRGLVELEENEEGKIIVVLVGVMNRIEVWPLKRWQEMETLLDASDDEVVNEEPRS